MRNFKLAYNLGRELSLDESIIGRVWLIQYMPKKPNKWGMKEFVLPGALLVIHIIGAYMQVFNDGAYMQVFNDLYKQ